MIVAAPTTTGDARPFASMVTRLDLYVGQIIQKVNDLGLSKNTLIIFTSDNGPHIEGGADPEFFNSNGNLTGYKRDLYEGGIRVPMIVRWQGFIEPATNCDHISAFWDFLPTACELAGIQVPQGTDGISYVPSLIREEQESHKYLYWEFHEKGGRQAVRMGDWKAVKYNIFTDADAKVRLYNISKDIGEKIDVAELNPEITREMEAIMLEAHQPSEIFPFPRE